MYIHVLVFNILANPCNYSCTENLVFKIKTAFVMWKQIALKGKKHNMNINSLDTLFQTKLCEIFLDKMKGILMDMRPDR
jgi:hypothetical protein